MEDFASAAMVRALAQGMRDEGLQPPAPIQQAAVGAAQVPLDAKRAIVMAAVEQAGFACLPRLGRGLHKLAGEPTHRALCSAVDAPDLFRRWLRLERYVHSRHRVEILDHAECAAILKHVSLGSEPPSAAEDLVVLGVLAALLEAIGLTEVAITLDDVPVYPQADAAALAQRIRIGQTACWSFRWHGAARTAAAPAPAAAVPTLADDAWPPLAREACNLLARDLLVPKRVAELAQALGLATRSLQRGLQQAGLTYSDLLAEARCRTGSWWLVHTAAPVTEVGFVSGYADQPHFTRDFKARVGLTPARFREEFGQA